MLDPVAIERLLAVKAHILAEPLRAYMDDWRLDASYAVKIGHLGAPACGTVACIAGWGWTLFGSDDTSYEEALSVSVDQGDDLFIPRHWPKSLRDALDGHRSGSPEYAQVVADAIDLFVANGGAWEPPDANP